LHSQLLFRSAQDRSNPILADMQAQIFKTSTEIFSQIFREAQEGGEIGTTFSAEFIALTTISQSLALRSYLETTLGLNLAQNIQDSNTVFAHESARIFEFVDQSIAMFRIAFSKPSTL
jgi:hypothetical protein